MPTTISIERVPADDIDRLMQLSRKTFFDAFASRNGHEQMEGFAKIAFTTESFTQQLANPNSEFYYTLVNGNIAGYIKLNFNNAQTELQDPDTMELERIYVLNDYQGMQIGSQLLQFAFNKALEKSLSYIWLGVWDQNHDAIRFYQRQGFTMFGSHPFWLGNEEQTDLLMRKAL
ncbi:GNAT family N-acetyltransferase [Mucilaginibacter terrenus]|uniref:GNAT family N-acetyltransferase n=1 Tax=Mucilaginibacter terrenus TaxID=2482727 RepID=A0A3E2NVD4_9SPHI|nr:GNAT family N-acetyltransferase [Mucilaginibacter terrenus]RFZ84929.1 GNAT family N-acetyltransferase [Mucilaginibacter terrenus]